ncbi:hypothetical protein [Sulfurimonas indica]|uniref:hypothetical protein n=1 Tax=Sulfurimonas TaxID=202746 RepID=UPI00126571AE|nr:hypothetical protein [Sulfurimonas indica]
MTKKEAKKIARDIAGVKMLSDVKALYVLYVMQEKKSSLNLDDAIECLEKYLFGGSKSDDLIIFMRDENNNIVESVKCTKEESFRQPYRALIDQWEANQLKSLIYDMIENDLLPWEQELKHMALKSKV